MRRAIQPPLLPCLYHSRRLHLLHHPPPPPLMPLKSPSFRIIILKLIWIAFTTKLFGASWLSLEPAWSKSLKNSLVGPSPPPIFALLIKVLYKSKLAFPPLFLVRNPFPLASNLRPKKVKCVFPPSFCASQRFLFCIYI